MNKKVAVGLSGGVDSSVAAALLKKDGYDVVGITMKIWDGAIEVQEANKHACYGPGEEGDIKIAQEICDKLGIPYHVYDLTNEYKEHVLQYFKDEYLAGRTPNPCVVCNHKLKFGFLINKAREAGLQFDYFATGHYAKIEQIDYQFVLRKSDDLKKDQTYFLSGIDKNLLPNLLFPLANYNKKDVRTIAHQLGFSVADSVESQDFIAGGDYTPLFKNDKIKAGEIVDEAGKILGKHNGIIHYTIGQRKGLGLSSANPLYVLKIDAKSNRIVVTDKDKLFSEKLIVTDFNKLHSLADSEEFDCSVKIRQQHKESNAEIKNLGKNKFQVAFNTPQLAVTPGQTAVFYLDDIVIGGGVIE